MSRSFLFLAFSILKYRQEKYQKKIKDEANPSIISIFAAKENYNENYKPASGTDDPVHCNGRSGESK